MHLCHLHCGQRFLLTEDGEAAMASTIHEQLHCGLLLFPLVTLDGFLGRFQNTTAVIMHIEVQRSCQEHRRQSTLTAQALAALCGPQSAHSMLDDMIKCLSR